MSAARSSGPHDWESCIQLRERFWICKRCGCRAHSHAVPGPYYMSGGLLCDEYSVAKVMES